MHSDNLTTMYYVCVGLGGSISGTLLLMRLYTKLHIVDKIDVTDFVGHIAITHGFGQHQWNITMKQLISTLYWVNVAEIMYPVPIVLIKVTILIQYMRLFAPYRTVNPFVWYGALAIIIINVTFYTINSFFSVFRCSPREKFWNPLITEGHCINRTKMILFLAVFNILSDIAILILPLKTVWTLRIQLRKRVGISILCAMGIL
ncbi:hypothetical protein N0V90_011351 [Kalmusia sp. IMI 367209]|nr:hypothetical protein N0V90_011351 [Kalmusia sp. IMI 367209]